MAREKNLQKRRAFAVYDGLLLFFLLLLVVVVLRVLWIQYVLGDALRAEGHSVTYREEELEASRGNIVAEDGRLLATSLPRYSIRMDFAARGMKDSVFSAGLDSLALELSRLFADRSQESYRRELVLLRRAGARYARIGSRNVSYLELKRLRQFPIFRLPRNQGGLIVEQEYRRMKPLGDLASRTIGYCNRGEVCVGLEGAFDEELRGTPGLRITRRSHGGKSIPIGSADHVQPVDGLDVVTTIDINLQDVVARALRTQLQKHAAEHGTVVVMEVATGEVRAIANLTRNAGGGYSEQVNYAVGASTEPGSTFKLAALIALLEDGHIMLDDTVQTGNGVLRVYDQSISDTRRGGWGSLTVREVWEKSSNVGVAKLVLEAYKGRESDFVNRLYSMRLNQPLGVSIRGEVAPDIKSPADPRWSGVSLPMMSIGYEVEMTPLQILAFYNAVANDGRLVRPRFVRELRRHGRVVKRFGPEVLDRAICSSKTLEQVQEVLAGVVERGTAKNLDGAIYSMAGKTGTAQIALGREGYKRGGRVQYQASFVGYFPADAPRYSCIVVVNSPTTSGYYGNVVAGPIFREIAQKVYATRSEWFPHCASDGQPVVLASKAGHRELLTEALGGMGARVVDESAGSSWVEPVRRGDTVILRARREFSGLVPNVVGMPLSDALYILENSGFRVRVRGRGSVRRQSVMAGERVRRGGEILLEMSVL